jgi:ubiquinone/menaquinone biosynthesis C-methylase UbiE
MPLRDSRRLSAHSFGLLPLLLLGIAPSPSEAQVATTQRDAWQKVDEIFAALQVEEGDWIADVGAGSGFFSFRLSPRVGPSGKVIAQDIDAGVLAELRDEARREGIDNIETVVGATDDPRLPEGSLDGVLIVNAYHEMREYDAMLGGIKRALRPGGRLVIVDMPPADESASRRSQVQQHDIAIGIVVRDLVAGGFEVTRQVPAFIDAGRRRNWLLVAVVPDGR